MNTNISSSSRINIASCTPSPKFPVILFLYTYIVYINVPWNLLEVYLVFQRRTRLGRTRGSPLKRFLNLIFNSMWKSIYFCVFISVCLLAQTALCSTSHSLSWVGGGSYNLWIFYGVWCTHFNGQILCVTAPYSGSSSTYRFWSMAVCLRQISQYVLAKYGMNGPGHNSSFCSA